MNPRQDLTMELLVERTIKGVEWTSSWDVARDLAASGVTKDNGSQPNADTAARFLAPLKAAGLLERQMMVGSGFCNTQSRCAHWRLTEEARASVGLS